MSAERALLERHCNWKLSPDEHLKLLKETKEFLAQPEQPKQEPLSDEKLKTIAVEDEFLFYCNEDEFIEIARAIEKAHGIGEQK